MSWFYFCSCNSIGDNGLAALSSGCRKLEKLNLSYCIEVTDTGMEYISQFKYLSDLELRGLVKITGTGLTVVAAGCMRLTELDLKHCQKIKDSGFWALAFYSRNLRQVWLTIIKLEYEILPSKMCYVCYIIIRNYILSSVSNKTLMHCSHYNKK